MKFLFFISVCYLLAMPCQGKVTGKPPTLPRSKFVTIGLDKHIRNAHKGNYRTVAELLREYIDFNREKKAWEASSIALTVRRIRGVYPAERFAELLDLSPEELQSIESGTLIPNAVVMNKVVKSLMNDAILDYYQELGVSVIKRAEMFLNRSDLVASITNVVGTEVFLASLNKALQEAEAGSEDAAKQITIVEDGLKLDHPDAPHTFTELAQEAAPVLKKLSKDSEIVNIQFDELAFSKTRDQEDY